MERKQVNQLPELPEGIRYAQGILFSWVCEECGMLVGGGILNARTKDFIIEKTKEPCPKCRGKVAMRFGDDRSTDLLREILE